MSFRLPDSLAVGGQYQVVNAGDVAVLEEALAPRSHILVGLVFEESYQDLLADCQRAEEELQQAGIPVWPEYGRLVTPDPDGQPVVWVSYLSSPAFWTPILLIIGSIFLLPIISVLPVWIIDELFPGAMDIITMLAVLGMMGGVMMFMPKTRKERK